MIPLLVELKSSGRTLIDINTPYQEQNIHMFDTHMFISNLDGNVEVYQSKNKKSSTKTTTTKKPAKQIVRVEEPVKYTKKTTKTVEEPQQEEDDYDNLSETLRDITTRYSELDFSDDSDMDKKLDLINDIENLIETETDKGEGLDSDNADVRQIFVQLQSIVDDMKSAL